MATNFNSSCRFSTSFSSANISPSSKNTQDAAKESNQPNESQCYQPNGVCARATHYSHDACASCLVMSCVARFLQLALQSVAELVSAQNSRAGACAVTERIERVSVVSCERVADLQSTTVRVGALMRASVTFSGRLLPLPSHRANNGECAMFDVPSARTPRVALMCLLGSLPP